MLARLGMCFILLFSGCSSQLVHSDASIEEASGVIRQGNALSVVDDSVAGAYFRIPLRGTKHPSFH
jgi:hypothetical protein